MILDYSEYITEKASKGLVNYSEIKNNINLFTHNAICPFCNKKISDVVYKKTRNTYPEWLFGSFDESETVIQCSICGWWEYQYSGQSDAVLDGIRATDIEYSSAILRKYTNDSIDVPIAVLRTYIEKKPEIIYNINPHVMEDLVRSVFSDFYTNCTVKTFGKTRDGGKDGVLIDSEGHQTLIQIKRRSNPTDTEGVEALRELIGVAAIEDNVNGCIFVSTADHFSKPATEYAEQVVKKTSIEKYDLIDCKSFLDYLKLTKDKVPIAWNKLLKLKS